MEQIYKQAATVVSQTSEVKTRIETANDFHLMRAGLDRLSSERIDLVGAQSMTTILWAASEQLDYRIVVLSETYCRGMLDGWHVSGNRCAGACLSSILLCSEEIRVEH